MTTFTRFIQNGLHDIECTIDGLYTPVESLTQVILNGKRIEHLAWEDVITRTGIIRTIYFSYWKEPAAEETKDVHQLELPHRH